MGKGRSKIASLEKNSKISSKHPKNVKSDTSGDKQDNAYADYEDDFEDYESDFEPDEEEQHEDGPANGVSKETPTLPPSSYSPEKEAERAGEKEESFLLKRIANRPTTAKAASNVQFVDREIKFEKPDSVSKDRAENRALNNEKDDKRQGHHQKEEEEKRFERMQSNILYEHFKQTVGPAARWRHVKDLLEFFDDGTNTYPIGTIANRRRQFGGRFTGRARTNCFLIFNFTFRLVSLSAGL